MTFYGAIKKSYRKKGYMGGIVFTCNEIVLRQKMVLTSFEHVLICFQFIGFRFRLAESYHGIMYWDFRFFVTFFCR